jgi:hypothetical protein
VVAIAAMVATLNVVPVHRALQPNPCLTKAARNNATKAALRVAAKSVRLARAISVRKATRHVAKMSVPALTRSSMATIRHKHSMAVMPAQVVIVPAIIAGVMIAPVTTGHRVNARIRTALRQIAAAMAIVQAIITHHAVTAHKVLAIRATAHAAMKAAAKALAIAMVNKPATAPPVTAKRHAVKHASKGRVRALATRALATSLPVEQQAVVSPSAKAALARAVVLMSVVAVGKTPSPVAVAVRSS